MKGRIIKWLLVLVILASAEGVATACGVLFYPIPYDWKDRTVGSDFIVKAVIKSVTYFKVYSWRAVVDVKENLRGTVGEKSLRLEYPTGSPCFATAKLRVGDRFIFLLSRQQKKNGVYRLSKFDVYKDSGTNNSEFEWNLKFMSRFKWRSHTSGLKMVLYPNQEKVGSQSPLTLSLALRNISKGTLRLGMRDYRIGRKSVWVRLVVTRDGKPVRGRLLGKKLRAFRRALKKGPQGKPVVLKPGEWTVEGIPVTQCWSRESYNLSGSGFRCYPKNRPGKYRFVAVLENFPRAGKRFRSNPITVIVTP